MVYKCNFISVGQRPTGSIISPAYGDVRILIIRPFTRFYFVVKLYCNRTDILKCVNNLGLEIKIEVHNKTARTCSWV
jgi:hypothetical protein